MHQTLVDLACIFQGKIKEFSITKGLSCIYRIGESIQNLNRSHKEKNNANLVGYEPIEK